MFYFRDYPRTAYIFGDQLEQGGVQVTSDIFQDISLYTEVIDQVKDNVSFYSKYYIQENDRPDQVSYKLYGTTIYHWTFYFMNDHLRKQGWPLTLQQLEKQVKRDFPHRGFTSRADLTDHFLPGQVVRGLRSGATGTVLRRYLDLGVIIGDFNKSFQVGETVASVASGDRTLSSNVQASYPEYLAPHHYENASGETVDIDPFLGPGALLTEVTNYDRYVKHNDQLKEIIVIKPDLIQEVVSAFRKAIKS